MAVVVTNFQPPITSTTFVVPTGVTSLAMVVRGGSGGPNTTVGQMSGYGARMSGLLSVTPGETLYLQIGGTGGSAGSSSINGTGLPGYPDGGTGGAIGVKHGGGGGGSTRIWRGSLGGTLLVLCGGGGGLGATEDGNHYNRFGDAGLDPAFNGVNGRFVGGDISGHGATPLAGGAAGTGGGMSPTPGSSMQGGNGGNGSGSGFTIRYPGGAGGGGLFGGGGGDRELTSRTSGGGCGGGGTSFIAASGWTDVAWTQSAITQTTSVVDGIVRITYTEPIGRKGLVLGMALTKQSIG